MKGESQLSVKLTRKMAETVETWRKIKTEKEGLKRIKLRCVGICEES